METSPSRYYFGKSEVLRYLRANMDCTRIILGWELIVPCDVRSPKGILLDTA